MARIMKIDEYNNTFWSQAEGRYEHDTFFDEDTEEYRNLIDNIHRITRLPKEKCEVIVDTALDFWGKKKDEYEKVAEQVNDINELTNIVCNDLQIELKDFCKTPNTLYEMCYDIADYLIVYCS